MQEIGYGLCQSGSNAIFESIVFSSGSAQGVGYLGCLPALIHADILRLIKRVAGSSAGSIMAALVAVGCDFSRLQDESMNMQQELLKTDFSKLLGERVGNIFFNELGVCAITRDGKPLKKKIREFVNATLLNFFGTETGKTLSAHYPLIKKISDRFASELDPKLTFRDLYYLHKALPERFKKLTILAVELPSGNKCVLDYKTAPDCEIARACRASSAIPVIQTPVKVRVNGVKRLVTDGGLLDFLPSEYFKKNRLGSYFNDKEKQTLLFAFADHPVLEKSSAFKAIYTDVEKIYEPMWIERIVRDYGPWLLGDFDGPYTNTEQWNLVFERIRQKYADNLVILGIGEVQRYEFQKATRLGREMSAVSYIDTLSYLVKRLPSCTSTVEGFFDTFTANFCCIYLALIKAAGIDPQTDHFYNESQNYLSDQKIDLSSVTEGEISKFCLYVRERVRNRFESYECFALSRACEFGQNLLTIEELRFEIYQRSLSPSEESSSLDLSLFCGCNNSKKEAEGAHLFSGGNATLEQIDLEDLRTYC